MSDGPALILDGYSLVFRSFYALPPMSTRAGVPTGALYGVSVLLLKLLREERPAALAFALDAPGPTVRHEAFGAYKAGRAPAPDPLREQLVRLRSWPRRSGRPSTGSPAGRPTTSSPRCAAPCPGRRWWCRATPTSSSSSTPTRPCCSWAAARKSTSATTWTPCAPATASIARDPHLQALAGDPSDNLPGIPGIGAKTAAQLVLEHGDAAGIVAAHATLPARARRALADHLEALPRWEQLATLNRELPLAPPLTGPADGYDALRTWFAANEFKSLLARVEALAAGTTAPPRAGGRSRRA
ncbi:MAG: 5'-3' exonuclease H3TH domain-containing protein [Myxococcota bacterium]